MSLSRELDDTFVHSGSATGRLRLIEVRLQRCTICAIHPGSEGGGDVGHVGSDLAITVETGEELGVGGGDGGSQSRILLHQGHQCPGHCRDIAGRYRDADVETVEVAVDARQLCSELLDRGVVVNAVTPTALRLAPSLLIDDEELRSGTSSIAETVAEILEGDENR